MLDEAGHQAHHLIEGVLDNFDVKKTDVLLLKEGFQSTFCTEQSGTLNVHPA